MPLRPCDFTDCLKPAERDTGSCMICSSHRCIEHLGPEHHAWPSEAVSPEDFFAAYDAAKEKHLLALLAKVDFAALQATASRLRSDVPCTLPAIDGKAGETDRSVNLRLVLDQMGGQNCHLDIDFADGIVWIARLRLEDPTLPPLKTQKQIFESEVSVLNFLREKTQVPVPKIFHHAFEQSEIGTPFVLMEKLPGAPLQWTDATAQQKSKVMEQLVEIFLELEKHPFPKLGSFSPGGVPPIGPFAQGHMFYTPARSIGPFESFVSALTSIIEHEIEMIDRPDPGLDRQTTAGSYYIKHFDDKGDHILVDEQFNITGIIDWEFASTESKQLAFSSPCMMWPVKEYYDGSNQLSTEEVEFAAMFQRRGRDDMARIVLEGRKYQRFLFFLGSPVSPDRKEFEDMFQGLREAFEGPGIESYAEWREATVARASDNRSILRRLVQAEQQVGGAANLA